MRNALVLAWLVVLTAIMVADWYNLENFSPTAYHARQVATARAGSQPGDLVSVRDWWCHGAWWVTGRCPDPVCSHYHATARNPLTGEPTPLIGEP